MTKYMSRAQINQATAKMDADDRRRAAGREVSDPACALDFAGSSLWTPEVRQMTVPSASDMGVFALSLVRHVLAPVRELAKTDSKAAADALLKLLQELEMPDARAMQLTVRDLARFSDPFRLVLKAKAGRNGPQLNSHYFGASVTAFQSGYDGHWITREAALRLRLVRHYEKTSGDFSRVIFRAMAALTHTGAAYEAWSRGWPVFVCNLNRTYERYAAQEIVKAARGEVLTVTKPLTNDTRMILARHARGMAFVEDAADLLATLLGNFGTVMLLERRVGGWTVTFPAGGAAVKDLKNSKYPAFARALSRCAATTPALSEMQPVTAPVHIEEPQAEGSGDKTQPVKDNSQTDEPAPESQTVANPQEAVWKTF